MAFEQFIDAGEVMRKLTELGHDYNPQKQLYRGEIGGWSCRIYDPNSLNREGLPAEVIVPAQNVDKYIAKGFLTARPTPEEVAAAEAAAAPPTAESTRADIAAYLDSIGVEFPPRATKAEMLALVPAPVEA